MQIWRTESWTSVYAEVCPRRIPGLIEVSYH